MYWPDGVIRAVSKMQLWIDTSTFLYWPDGVIRAVSKMQLCVLEDIYALFNSYFVLTHMIGKWWESLIIHPIRDYILAMGGRQHHCCLRDNFYE